MSRITGEQARELLDIWEGDEDSLVMARLGTEIRYGYLFAAAPALAETVAWLYGRQADSVDSDGRSEWAFEMFMEVSTFGGMVYDLDGREFSPEGAVEYARALLAAAEEARQ